tara:strand:+ start:443 stop:592 length:150 start_codon:yes stop_codon:yes gene_type:complete
MSSLSEIREDLVSVLKPEIDILMDEGTDVEEIIEELEEAILLLKEIYGC